VGAAEQRGGGGGDCGKPAGRRHRIEEERLFFFEKKNQKTFICWFPRKLNASAPGGEGAGAKVFCFFSKRRPCFLKLFYTKETSAPQIESDEPHVSVIMRRHAL
jgi:hypothetical protein